MLNIHLSLSNMLFVVLFLEQYVISQWMEGYMKKRFKSDSNMIKPQITVNHLPTEVLVGMETAFSLTGSV